MTKQLTRTCRAPNCRTKFNPKGTTQVCCHYVCVLEYMKWLQERKLKNEGVILRRKNKLLEEKIRSHSGWLQILQKLFNRWVVLRDKTLPCISCGTTKDVMYSCGHFYTVGSYPNLRFDPDNTHKQCLNFCNKNQHGNLAEYRPNLIRKIGQKKFDELEGRRHTLLKLSIPEIKELITEYKAKIKHLK